MGQVHALHGGLATASCLSLLAWEPDLSTALPLRIMPHKAQLIDVDLAVCSARELELHDFHGSMVYSISPLPHSCSSPSPSKKLTLQHSSKLMSLLFSSKDSITLCVSFLGIYFSFSASVCICECTTSFLYSECVIACWVFTLLCRFVHVGACVDTHEEATSF